MIVRFGAEQDFDRLAALEAVYAVDPASTLFQQPPSVQDDFRALLAAGYKLAFADCGGLVGCACWRKNQIVMIAAHDEAAFKALLAAWTLDATGTVEIVCAAHDCREKTWLDTIPTFTSAPFATQQLLYTGNMIAIHGVVG